jgi:hypothetical protein
MDFPLTTFDTGSARMNYVGVDHHRQSSHLTVMDQEGQGLRSGRDSIVRAAEPF